MYIKYCFFKKSCPIVYSKLPSLLGHTVSFTLHGTFASFTNLPVLGTFMVLNLFALHGSITPVHFFLCIRILQLYMIRGILWLFVLHWTTICPISLDPFYIVSFYIKWGKTSWSYSMSPTFKIVMILLLWFPVSFFLLSIYTFTFKLTKIYTFTNVWWMREGGSKLYKVLFH